MWSLWTQLPIMFAFYRPTPVVTKGSGPEIASRFVFNLTEHPRYLPNGLLNGAFRQLLSQRMPRCVNLSPTQTLVSLWERGTWNFLQA